jgi:hypothetical protein
MDKSISEEVPPMQKVKAGLIFGAIALFSIAAQACVSVTPGT